MPVIYRVLRRTSMRKSFDPKSPAYNQWIDFHKGKLVRRPPEHAPIDKWLASGHWVIAEEGDK